MSERVHALVFIELYRVLRPGGSVYIWDAPIPVRGKLLEKYVCVHVDVRMEKKMISVDYGRSWPDRALTREYYSALARKSGFSVQAARDNSAWFSIHLQK